MHSDLDEFSRRIGQVRDQLQQGAADYPAPAPQRPATHDHGQEQTATRQQHRSQGTHLYLPDWPTARKTEPLAGPRPGESEGPT
ncbi:hypothetical protein ABZX74_16750 [Streptomyces olivaceoviridis]|uniref:hypothetical protein n=1 Tax=Streptomyces olivaceoviridis TaxID=1921 RepID=UPI0033AB86BC